MVWVCVSSLSKGNLYICDDTINAKKAHRDLGVTHVACWMTSFPGTPMHILKKIEKKHILLT